MRGWSLPAAPRQGAINLLGEPAREMMSCADRLDPQTAAFDPQTRAALHGGMARLARGLAGMPENGWPDSLTGAAGPSADNPSIPAGYTYLLQLIGHDLVDSAVTPAPGARAGLFNARLRPLLLDTIYGYGPDANALPYDDDRPGDAFRNEPGRMPRRYLRSVPLDPALKPARSWCCPFRDIARYSGGENAVDGGPAWSEPLLADPRNDAHALMSQMTVLFHVAHNALYRAMAAATGDLARTDIDMAHRIFACARGVLTLMYRQIVRLDVLPRILAPEVRAFYADLGGTLEPFRGVPVEFSAGAFRFGHAMVRRDYVFNSGPAPAPGPSFVALGSRRAPHRMPLTAPWMVDWAFFFDLRGKLDGAPTPTFSRRLGPRHSDALEIDPIFLPRAPDESGGLASRDNISSIYAAQWRVDALSARLARLVDARKPGLGARLLADVGGHWSPLIRRFLEASPAFAGHVPDVDRLASDPPWPFFTLFEAGFRKRGGAASAEGMGRHLGPLGSMVVAETVIGALDATELVPGEAESLPEAVAALCRHCLGREVAIPGITTPLQPAGADGVSLPEDMPSFLMFLKRLGAFGPA